MEKYVSSFLSELLFINPNGKDPPCGWIKIMSAMTRREAREQLIGLLFETEFRKDESAAEIYATSTENREIPQDSYIKKAYFAIDENKETIDKTIGAHAKGWKTHRLSNLSRSVLRLAVYEMLYEEAIPYSVSINEAVELTKKFDEDKARPFVNGILNSIKESLETEQGENVAKQS